MVVIPVGVCCAGALERNLAPLVATDVVPDAKPRPVAVNVSGVAFPHPEKVSTHPPAWHSQQEHQWRFQSQQLAVAAGRLPSCTDAGRMLFPCS